MRPPPKTRPPIFFLLLPDSSMVNIAPPITIAISEMPTVKTPVKDIRITLTARDHEAAVTGGAVEAASGAFASVRGRQEGCAVDDSRLARLPHVDLLMHLAARHSSVAAGICDVRGREG